MGYGASHVTGRAGWEVSVSTDGSCDGHVMSLVGWRLQPYSYATLVLIAEKVLFRSC